MERWIYPRPTPSKKKNQGRYVAASEVPVVSNYFLSLFLAPFLD